MKDIKDYTNTEKIEFAIAVMNNLCKDSGNEASEELIANWVNKIFNEKAFSNSDLENKVYDKYKLKLETDLVVTMDGINEINVNGKDFCTKRKQGSIHERLNMMDRKIETLRNNEKQNAVLQVPGLNLPWPFTKQIKSLQDAMSYDQKEETTIDTSLTSMDGVYLAVCSACGSSFYMKKDQYEYCPYCSRKIKK